MRISELIKPKEIDQVRGLKISDKDRADRLTTDSPWKKISEYFKDRGFSPVGSGSRATVYDHPQYPFVIKFFYKDSAYRTWLKYCVGQQQNPYIPKIKGAPTQISKTDFYFVRLEKLHSLYDVPVDHDKMREFIDIIDLFWESPAMGIAKVEQEKEKESSKIDHLDSLLSVFSYLNGFKSYLDLHIGNLMTRSNGEFVIVDPLYSAKDSRFIF